MGNVGRGNFDTSKVEYIPDATNVDPADRLVEGDVILNTRNTLDLVGKVAIWRNELPEAYFNSNLLRLEFDSDEIASNAYANHALNSEVSIASLRGLATGTTSVAAIYTRDLLNLLIVVPPGEEQRAIAEVLSDVDGLIGALDKLIAKKRAIKQAAMQQLLTGKTRRPGFSGEWETKQLGDIAELKNGYAFKSSSYVPDGSYKIVTISNVQDGYLDLDSFNAVNDLPPDLQNHQRLHRGDILISMTGNVGRVCVVQENNLLLNQRVGKLVPRDIDGSFLFYMVHERGFLNAMIERAVGGAQGNLGKTDITSYQCVIPMRKAEQQAIATVLSDMDAEIEALERRREKVKQIKQGMMQQLLTGRIRLVHTEVN